MVELTSLKISVVLWDKVALGVPQAPRDQLMATGLVWSDSCDRSLPASQNEVGCFSMKQCHLIKVSALDRVKDWVFSPPSASNLLCGLRQIT